MDRVLNEIEFDWIILRCVFQVKHDLFAKYFLLSKLRWYFVIDHEIDDLDFAFIRV